MRNFGVMVIGVMLLLGFVFFLGYQGFKNRAVALKNQIEAQEKVNQTVLDSHWKKVAEAVQVTELQAEQVKTIYTDMITGRYQGNLQQSVQTQFKFVVEQNPAMDTTVYSKLMVLIEAGRNDFNREQKKLVDLVREFNTHIESFPGSMYNSIAGFLPKEAKIVTSDRTQDAWNTGKEQPVDLKGKK